jgi:microcystin-dependent protein
MANPYLGEIRLVGFNFAPQGWAFCNGALLSIGQNDALFALVGTTYGGDGQNTFALPDLQGRVPVHMSGPFPLGVKGGSESVMLNLQQIPSHNHESTMCSDGPGTSTTPVASGTWSMTTTALYLGNPPSVVMANQAIATVGANQAHENRQPSLAMNYIIALEGIFPSPN